MPRGAEKERHNPSHSAAGHRLQRETGQIQVGGGTNALVDQPLPAAESALRASRRHPSGVPGSRMRSHLLALRAAVMLGALNRREITSVRLVYPALVVVALGNGEVV